VTTLTRWCTNSHPSIIETTLTEHETLVRFRTGETLFREGEQPRRVYVLHSGTVQLLFAGKNGSASRSGKRSPGRSSA
jgi:CRP-like cAMP-binding protein